MTIDFGAAGITDIYYASTQIESVYWGPTKIWSAPVVVCQAFDESPTQILDNWIVDAIGAAGAGLEGIENKISNGFGQLINDAGAIVGYLVKYIPSPQAIAAQLTGIVTGQVNLGAMITSIPQTAETAVCTGLNSVGGVAQGGGSPQGITAFINSIPILGAVATWFETTTSNILISVQTAEADPLTALEGAISSVFGTIPVGPSLATVVGVLADQVSGEVNDAVNFITDETGAVLGYWTCGQYAAIESGVVQAAADIIYPVGVIGGVAKLLVPDGLVALAPVTGIARHIDETISSAEGWLEVGLGTVGAAGMATQIFRSFDSSGSALSGVGLDLQSSMVSIAVRVAGAVTLVAPQICSFAAGDVLRMTQALNELDQVVCTVYRNGIAIFQWIDTTGLCVLGDAFKAVGLIAQAGQDLLGPRQFSPGLSYVCAA